MTDRDEILQLIYRYAELIDAGDFEGLGKLLARAAFGAHEPRPCPARRTSPTCSP